MKFLKNIDESMKKISGGFAGFLKTLGKMDTLLGKFADFCGKYYIWASNWENHVLSTSVANN